MIAAQLRDAGSYNYFLAADRGHDPAIRSHRRQAAEQFPIFARTMIENPTLRDDIDRGRQPDDALSPHFTSHHRLRANGHQSWRVAPAIASLKSVSPRQLEGSSYPEDIVFSKLGSVRTDYDHRIVERHLNDQLPSLRHIPAFENSQTALAEISRNPKLYASLVVSDYALRDIVDMEQDLIRFCVRPSLLVLAGYADAERAGEAYLAIGSVINRQDHPRLKGLERAEDYARNVIMSEFKTPRQVFEAAEHWDAMRPVYKSTIAFAFQDEMKRPMEWNMAVQPYRIAGHTVVMLTSAEEIERESRNLGTDHHAKLGNPEHGFQPVFAIKNSKNETTSLFNAYPRYGEIKISHHQRASMPAPKGSLDRPSNKVSSLSADGAIATLWAKRVQEKQLKSNFLAYANHQHRDWLPQDSSAVFGQAKRQLVWANLRGASPVMLPHPTPEEFLRTWRVLEVMQGAPIPIIPSAGAKANATQLAI